MSIDVKKLKMPAISSDGIEALELILTDDFSMAELTNIIVRDPTLSATLLKYANSPMYNPMTEVTNVQRAIAVLGVKALRAAIMVATMRSFEKPSQTSELLWEHSQAVANIAKLIAKRHFPSLADDIELAALLHNIGALILATNFPVQYEEIISSVLADDTTLSLSEIEHETFGLNHDDITIAFIRSARLPKSLEQILGDFHSRPPLIDTHDIIRQQTAIISLAHRPEQSLNNHTASLNESPSDSIESLQSNLGLSDDDIEDFLEDYDELTMALA